jgi:hypothetical protein
MLEKEIDKNGNYIRYVYTKDHNQIYPQEIIYTGHVSSDGPLTVTFATSSRPDVAINFSPGFEVDTYYRISQITAAVNGSTVRQYNLSYTTGNNGDRSLLSSLQENGWNSSNTETTLPAMTFGYMSSSTSFVSVAGSGTVSGDPYIAVDVNGDGINDSTNISCNTTTGPEDGYIYQNGTTSTTFTPPQGMQIENDKTFPREIAQNQKEESWLDARGSLQTRQGIAVGFDDSRVDGEPRASGRV